MTRRSLIFIAAASTLLAAEESPRNQLCTSANEFHQPYTLWAERMNAGKPGTIPADAVEAFEPLPNLWRRVEHKFRTWLRGY